MQYVKTCKADTTLAPFGLTNEAGLVAILAMPNSIMEMPFWVEQFAQ